MTHDESLQRFNFSIFLSVIIKRTRAPRGSLSDCQNLQTIAKGLVQRVTADPHWLLCSCGSSCPRCWGKASLSFPNVRLQLQSPARGLFSQLHVSDSPEDHQHPGECTQLTVSDQDKLHTTWSRSGEASPKLVPLSEDLHRENGGLTVLRTSKHLRELFPSTMPIVLFSCSVTSNISLVFIADRQKSSSSKDFSRRFFWD